MKLIIRTNFWGARIKGAIVTPNDGVSAPYRLIMAQSVFQDLYDACPRILPKAAVGCCPFHGARALELTERYFLDHYTDNWTLFLMRKQKNTVTYPNGETAGIKVYEYLLAPENQTSIDVQRAMECEGWQLWGNLRASILRIDLEPLLLPLRQENKRHGRTVCHAHIFILMDSILDPNSPGNSTKNRTGRGDRREEKSKRPLKGLSNNQPIEICTRIRGVEFTNCCQRHEY